MYTQTKQRREAILNVFFILIVTFFVFSCNQKPTSPGNGKPEKDFVWSVDTIINPQGIGVFLKDSWGSSSKDVWMVGFDYQHQGVVFHLDGGEWKNITPALSFKGIFKNSPNFVEKIFYVYLLRTS